MSSTLTIIKVHNNLFALGVMVILRLPGVFTLYFPEQILAKVHQAKLQYFKGKFNKQKSTPIHKE